MGVSWDAENVQDESASPNFVMFARIFSPPAGNVAVSKAGTSVTVDSWYSTPLGPIATAVNGSVAVVVASLPSLEMVFERVRVITTISATFVTVGG